MSYRLPKIELPDLWGDEEPESRRRPSRAEEKAIYKRYKGKCAICKRKTDFSDGEIDHIKPLSKGGSDSPRNKQWLCHRCNKLKGNTRTNTQVRKLLGINEKKKGKRRKVGKRRRKSDIDFGFRIPKFELPKFDL